MLETFYCEVELFGASMGEWPPSRKRYGVRLVEWVTVDALLAHMEAIGLGLDPESAADFFELGRVVSETVGECEVAGVIDAAGVHRLFVVTPSRQTVEINPQFAHRDYRFGWGDLGSATLDVARIIGERVLGSCGAVEAEMFALGLASEVLQSVDGSFSLSIASLCDWWLVDAEPHTSLDIDVVNMMVSFAPTS